MTVRERPKPGLCAGSVMVSMVRFHGLTAAGDEAFLHGEWPALRPLLGTSLHGRAAFHLPVPVLLLVDCCNDETWGGSTKKKKRQGGPQWGGRGVTAAHARLTNARAASWSAGGGHCPAENEE